MESNNTPDSWEQQEDAGSGDQSINDMAKDLGGLNVHATPFVPGQNVFAKEFVPTFNTNSECNAENDENSDNTTAEKVNMEKENCTGPPPKQDSVEEAPDDWADKAEENGGSPDEGGGGGGGSAGSDKGSTHSDESPDVEDRIVTVKSKK